jgi:glycosyltransferase involved in cell wall biosynthesis
MLNERISRVAYVLKVYPRFSETFIVNEILALEAAGCEVEIFATRPPVEGRFHEELARVRARVTYLPHHNMQAVEFWSHVCNAADAPDFWERFALAQDAEAQTVVQALTLADMLRERQIDHVHAHFGSVATTLARLAAHFAGVSYSFTAHAKDLYHETVDPIDMRRKLADAAAVVTISDYNLAYLREQFGLAATNVRRIYNGLDLTRFSYRVPTGRPPRIVAVGRLVEKKGFDVLVDACALLHARGRHFTCDIVGSGNCEPALREQIASSGLQAQVQLLGPLPQREVAATVQQAAVFAAPCVIGADGNRDGLPTVLLEAMALGTPCITTDVTGIPEIIEDGVTGLLVGQRDAHALADAIERLLDDNDLQCHLSKMARQRIEHDFDITINSAALRALFEEVQTTSDRIREVA